MFAKNMAFLTSYLAVASSASGQLVSAYDGDEPGARSWVTDVCELDDAVGSPPGPFGGVEAMAADNTTGRLFGSAGSGITTIQVSASGEFTSLGSVSLRDPQQRRFRDLNSLAFGRGRLVGLNFQRNAGFGDPPTGLHEIDPDTGMTTLLYDEDSLTFDGVPCFSSPSRSCLSGLAYDPDRDRLYIGVQTAANEQAIISFDPISGVGEVLRRGSISFDGLAYGANQLYLTSGSGPITVIDLATGEVDGPFVGPRRFGNGRGGATFLASLSADRSSQILAFIGLVEQGDPDGDVNEDNQVDFFDVVEFLRLTDEGGCPS